MSGLSCQNGPAMLQRNPKCSYRWAPTKVICLGPGHPTAGPPSNLAGSCWNYFHFLEYCHPHYIEEETEVPRGEATPLAFNSREAGIPAALPAAVPAMPRPLQSTSEAFRPLAFVLHLRLTLPTLCLVFKLFKFFCCSCVVLGTLQASPMFCSSPPSSS